MHAGDQGMQADKLPLNRLIPLPAIAGSPDQLRDRLPELAKL